ncbi:hypothetical protein BH10CYA1_BH10CYA1_47000 [soil metagenome]
MCPAKFEKILHIGDFNVVDGSIVATDPCNKTLDGSGTAFFSNCEVGLWHAFVEDDTADTYKLIVISSQADPDLSSWTISLGDFVTVVSGQAGLFDKARYQYDQEFYEKLCDLTARDVGDVAERKLPGLESWCFEWGAVSATATGDGKFLCHAMLTDEGITVGVAIDFYRSYTDWKDISLNRLSKSARVSDWE